MLAAGYSEMVKLFCALSLWLRPFLKRGKIYLSKEKGKHNLTSVSQMSPLWTFCFLPQFLTSDICFSKRLSVFVTAVQLLRHNPVFKHLMAENERKLFLLEVRKDRKWKHFEVYFSTFGTYCRVNVRWSFFPNKGSSYWWPFHLI